ncbi:hypothetical protein A7982_13696 [Minicystis rosea]|nr:hypothetical protein A7982_13696 [Minicystis rosea]
MFQDLDRTLKTLLSSELPSGLVDPQNGISFGPPSGATLTLPSINLYLFWIVENRELRTADRMVSRTTAGRAFSVDAPVRVDCHYMVSAWAAGGDEETKAATEHTLLGAALGVLARHPFIPDELRQGSLARQMLPLRTVILKPDQQQSRGDFWQALGGKPKASFSYVVTIGFDFSEPADVGATVTDL